MAGKFILNEFAEINLNDTFFGLDQNGFWAAEGQYPAEVKLTPAQFKRVLTEAI